MSTSWIIRTDQFPEGPHYWGAKEPTGLRWGALSDAIRYADRESAERALKWDIAWKDKTTIEPSPPERSDVEIPEWVPSAAELNRWFHDERANIREMIAKAWRDHLASRRDPTPSGTPTGEALKLAFIDGWQKSRNSKCSFWNKHDQAGVEAVAVLCLRSAPVPARVTRDYLTGDEAKAWKVAEAEVLRLRRFIAHGKPHYEDEEPEDVTRECDQCGAHPWPSWDSWQCPRHFDPNDGCDGTLMHAEPKIAASRAPDGETGGGR